MSKKQIVLEFKDLSEIIHKFLEGARIDEKEPIESLLYCLDNSNGSITLHVNLKGVFDR